MSDSARVRAENDALERELHRTMIQNQTLAKQIQAMDTEQGIIVAARQKGYMMPNERPLHIQK